MSAGSLSGYSRQYSPPPPLYLNGAAPAERPTRGPASMHFSLRDVIASLALLAACSFAQADELRTLKGLASPESAIVGHDGRIYVSEIGEFNKDGDGKITVIDQSGAPKVFATGLDDPKGLAARSGLLFVSDTHLEDRQPRARFGVCEG
jgi:hypothetical protein